MSYKSGEMSAESWKPGVCFSVLINFPFIKRGGGTLHSFLHKSINVTQVLRILIIKIL